MSASFRQLSYGTKERPVCEQPLTSHQIVSFPHGSMTEDKKNNKNKSTSRDQDMLDDDTALRLQEKLKSMGLEDSHDFLVSPLPSPRRGAPPAIIATKDLMTSNKDKEETSSSSSSPRRVNYARKAASLRSPSHSPRGAEPLASSPRARGERLTTSSSPRRKSQSNSPEVSPRQSLALRASLDDLSASNGGEKLVVVEEEKVSLERKSDCPFDDLDLRSSLSDSTIIEQFFGGQKN